MVRARNFDEQNFDELIVSFIGKALTGKRLEGKTLTNRWPFVKFVKVFPHQTFVLYGIQFLWAKHPRYPTQEFYSSCQIICKCTTPAEILTQTRMDCW